MNAEENEKLMSRFKHGVFKLNGLLLEESEIVLNKARLTSSRTRLLGVLLRAEKPLTIPQISVEMGQTRQGIGRLVGLMVEDGYLELLDNPVHLKSKLVACTKQARKVYDEVRKQHLRNALKSPYPVNSTDVEIAIDVIEQLIAHLEQKLYVKSDA